MRLADFILTERQSILREWESFARTIEPAAVDMSAVELRDHASTILQGIAEDLGNTQTRDEEIVKSHGGEPRTAQTRIGEVHGLSRLESSFTIEQLASEYRSLRSSVLRLWSEAQSSPAPMGSNDLGDIIRFNEAIDQLLGSSILGFVQATRSAEKLEIERKDQFLAMLGHELRNPLSPISAGATLLMMETSGPDVVKNVGKVISRQVTHMVSLVDDLLDVSRVTRGAIELKLEALDLRHAIHDAVEQVFPIVQTRQQTLEIPELSQSIPMLGDKKRLVQVFTNLLTNAAKYSPIGGHVWLTLEFSKNQVAVIVRDDGIGMTPEFVPHAFDMFTQASLNSDRSSGGLGLGLSLVKSLVELHGGRVTCTSAGLAMGSSFTVWLPNGTQEGPCSDRRRTRRVPILVHKMKKILVVDDNIDAAEVLCLLLQAAGYQVVMAHEASCALELARTECPDACVLDIGLPQMDGNELVRQLRANPATAGQLLIALSGYSEKHNREESIQAGFDYYMTKPVDFSKLQSVLDEYPKT